MYDLSQTEESKSNFAGTFGNGQQTPANLTGKAKSQRADLQPIFVA